MENDSVIVKSSTFLKGQLGVIARRNFKKGTVLFSVKGPILSRPTKYSFSVNLNRHIDPLKADGGLDFGHYLNHSCDPNTFIRVIRRNSNLPYIEIVARRNIKAGEEVAFDYASLEYDTVVKTDCKCSTTECRGVIHGFKNLPKHVVKKYKKEGVIPSHLFKIK